MSGMRQSTVVRYAIAVGASVGRTLGGIVRSWNDGAERMYRYTPREVIGRHISLLAPSDHADEITEILQRLRAGESIDRQETVRCTKDGRVLNVSLRISPV